MTMGGRGGAWCVALCLGFAGSACSLKRLTVDQTAAILAEAGRAFDAETDPELAAAALPASLKTMEGFLQASPEQPTLLRLLAEGYTSYAFGFIEAKAERLLDDSPQEADVLRKRAYALYLRARGFGLRLLAEEHEALAATLARGELPADAGLLAALSAEDVPAIFWVASPWAAAINVAKSDPLMVAQLGIVRALIARCIELDEAYFWAGPRMTAGAMEAALPAALGGKPEAARQHFERAISLTAGKHLMTRVMFARHVGLQSADRSFFERGLKEVLAADPDIEPRLALANRLAQRRAQRYLAAIDDLFLE